MEQVRVFVSAPIGDKFRVLTASGLLVATWVGLVVFSFDRFRASLIAVSNIGAQVVPGSPSSDRVAETVEIADMWVPGERTCLARSLATEVLLRIYGHQFEHRIGVERDDHDGVKAHSWIESDGEVLIGDLEDLGKYEPLPPLSADNDS